MLRCKLVFQTIICTPPMAVCCDSISVSMSHQTRVRFNVSSAACCVVFGNLNYSVDVVKSTGFSKTTGWLAMYVEM